METANRIFIYKDPTLEGVRAEIHYFHGDGMDITPMFKPVLKIDSHELQARLGMVRCNIQPAHNSNGRLTELNGHAKGMISDVKLRLSLGDTPTFTEAIGTHSSEPLKPAPSATKAAYKDESGTVHLPTQNEAEEPPAQWQQCVLKPDDVIDGTINYHGYQSRTYGTKNKPHYCVDLISNGFGKIPLRIWGVDLERALDEAQATIGDAVQIHCIGQEPVNFFGTANASYGKSNASSTQVKRKIYMIHKLGAPTDET